MVGATIIAGKYEVGALVVFADIREGTLQFGDILHGRSDIGLWLIEFTAGNAQMIGRTRHNLHKTFGTSKRNGMRVEGGLLIALGSEQTPVPTDVATIGHKQLVVMGDDTTLGIEHGREDTATHLLGSEHGIFLCFYLGDEFRTIPSLERSSEVGLLPVGLDMTGCGPCNEVGLAGIEAMDQFKTISADIYTKVTAQRISKALTKQILSAQ